MERFSLKTKNKVHQSCTSSTLLYEIKIWSLRKKVRNIAIARIICWENYWLKSEDTSGNIGCWCIYWKNGKCGSCGMVKSHAKKNRQQLEKDIVLWSDLWALYGFQKAEKKLLYCFYKI